MKINLHAVFTFCFAFATAYTFAQIDIDANGNPIGKNLNLGSIKQKDASLLRTRSSHTPVIINSIPSPVSGVNDIAYDGQYLWVEGFNAFNLYQISPINGTVIKTIPTNVSYPVGLTFDGNYLWLSDNNNLIIQKIDTANGNVLQTFPTPTSPTQSFPVGLAWDGINLWLNDIKDTDCSFPGDSAFNLNTSGQILQAFDAVSSCPTGLTFDGQYLWSSDNGSDELYKIDVSSFMVVDTIDAPGGQYPNGLAFDGQYLWVANNDADSLYQIDIGIVSGLHNVEGSRGIFIYPNPMSSHTTFRTDKFFKDAMLTIYNPFAQTVKQIKNISGQTITLQRDNLPSGLYFIWLTQDSKVILVDKLVITD